MRRPSRSFLFWLREPQTLIGLSALLLSLCGLFISLYEASLMREAQRAAVWPHVEVAVSITSDGVSFWVQNTGVGPARIETAAITYQGQPLATWDDFTQRLTGETTGTSDYYQSLLSGRVLPANDDPKTIFALEATPRPGPRAALDAFREGVLDETIDLTVCYCSVYDACWTTNLQDTVDRLRATATPTEARPVASCTATPSSAI